MGSAEQSELDETQLTEEARSFATDLFARFPELRRHAAMERMSAREGWTLVVTVPAPSGDPRSEVVVWVEGGDDPSVEFGDWHTHEGLWTDYLVQDGDDRRAFLDLIAGILGDRFVVCEDIGGIADGHATILDLSDPDSLLEELTSKHSPGRARLRSWSGRLDREVGLEDLTDPQRG